MPGISTTVCPHCNAKLKLRGADAAGKRITCPRCQKRFVAAPAAPVKRQPAAEVVDEWDQPEPDDEHAPIDSEEAFLDGLESVGSRKRPLPKKTVPNLPGRTKKPPVSEAAPRKIVEPPKERWTFPELGVFGWIIGGGIGGIVGAFIWAHVAVVTIRGLIFVACLMGGMVGFGVQLGSRGYYGKNAGFVAAAITFASYLFAQLLTVYQLTQNWHRAFQKIGNAMSGMDIINPFHVLFLGVAVFAAYWVGSGQSTE